MTLALSIARVLCASYIAIIAMVTAHFILIRGVNEFHNIYSRLITESISKISPIRKGLIDALALLRKICFFFFPCRYI